MAQRQVSLPLTQTLVPGIGRSRDYATAQMILHVHVRRVRKLAARPGRPGPELGMSPMRSLESKGSPRLHSWPKQSSGLRQQDVRDLATGQPGFSDARAPVLVQRPGRSFSPKAPTLTETSRRHCRIGCMTIHVANHGAATRHPLPEVVRHGRSRTRCRTSGRATEKATERLL